MQGFVATETPNLESKELLIFLRGLINCIAVQDILEVTVFSNDIETMSGENQDSKYQMDSTVEEEKVAGRIEMEQLLLVVFGMTLIKSKLHWWWGLPHK